MIFLRQFIVLLFGALQFAILIRVLLTWFPNLDRSNPLVQLLSSVTDPILEPARRLIPPFGGLDISPILVLFALQLLESVLLRVLS
ncbi:MAG: YggT family protein [Anaerolineae bacterium]|uniref:YggT family protein n=1 Tax=Candidatus Amarolinea dominans TaxID=3140696 RepID=UPI001DC3A18C|nr:YggT family protein [Anaerolineae bacterium]MBK7202023.1 YggT family protein [Anaerolineae bacterium]MBK9095215.1 YggT family protein [Anaerolineae bacterium]MBK9233114.1 YggT family protein [Anaerolineae bacterium]